ncbi:flagellar motor protein MotS [Oceanobacillus halophilus]|uniref:Flagellar motor protein MotB n=1 Tax=Oceanobacillus halophilus TaxID=930130 RepID=A0A494ZX18_9BACI|nr:flagellar motor protein MotS [Oceanobacillus halophilus]RKQ30538.1 flagellar motor protein MotB [Oceanobacillus halophilus]
MKRRKGMKTKNRGAPKWMVTYSDMVTLILVFFVLLFSMSQIDQERFEAVSESFQNRMIFDFFPSAVPMDNPTDHSVHDKEDELSDEFKKPLDNELDDKGNTTETEADSLNSLVEEVESFLDENNLNGVITANRSEEGVVLVLQESILFETGEAYILESAESFLDKIGVFLEDVPNNVRVEGHTDSRPIKSYRYPSNWELSGARASSVIRYLVNQFQIDDSRFISVGYGETKPVAPNDSEGNWRENRRVEIVILEMSKGAE